MRFLEISNVTKIYPNGTQAVHETSLSIEKGEFMVFVGPSGCGKSTLLRMVAGLEDISQGEISLDGKVINKIDPSERDVAMVFQNYALYPHMNVYNNLAYGLKNRGLDKTLIREKVIETAELLQISQFLDSKPSLLSGGQRQRVAMGRAIVRNPKIFLFDEPLSNLDALLRIKMRLEIKKLQREMGVTSIFVTHDQVEAMTLADRLAVINNGIIEQLVNSDGTGQVLVIDGGGSTRRALIDHKIAQLAADNHWEGIICYGSVRDVDALEEVDMGIQALVPIPVGASDQEIGECDLAINFAGVTILPDDHIYADNTGIVLSADPLDIE